ncbi:F-type H+-transporting ATPase subunit delta [Haloferula luteola]|uniref:F-type H+-transporting ATPase subunit delta n=1 Tax=Haloferula luteola TaxID=595692 RepID=A0A840V788_9BACT|nr:F0F1 ATP synthase subunit delta [Haloferula luteola]MBB5352906.1 F-type H+-transporting ATPase subunit delta [Haloferula luteola]
MKVSKVATTTARRIFRLCQNESGLDEAKLSLAVKQIAAGKPRDYRGILVALKRLVRLELERRHAVIHSAIPLGVIERERVAAGLRAKYGDTLTFEYQVDPSLLGGLRVRVGSDVWDGTVKNRLDRLAQAF